MEDPLEVARQEPRAQPFVAITRCADASFDAIDKGRVAPDRQALQRLNL